MISVRRSRKNLSSGYCANIHRGRSFNTHNVPLIPILTVAKRVMTQLQVIKTCLEIKEAFGIYIIKNSSNACQAFLAFRGLVRLFIQLVNDQKELEKKLDELEHTKSRMERALTYVED